MNCLLSILKFQTKQKLTKIVGIILLSILVLALWFIKNSISDYQNSQNHKKIFQDFEAKKVDQFISYRQYGTYGFRILFSPAPISILFSNSTILTELMSFIDSSARLYIYKPLKDKNVFEINQYWYADYSGILLFFGSLIALLFGYSTFANKEFQKFLASLINERRLFLTALTAQAIILALFFLVFIAAAITLIAIYGIHIGIDRFLLIFYIRIYFTSLVFLTLGSLVGSSKSLLKGLGTAFSCWFLLLFIFPALIGITVANMSDFIKPDYKIDMEKLTLLMDFEKQLRKKAGTRDLATKPSEVSKKAGLSFFKNEFQKMQNLEKELMVQITKHIRLYQLISCLCPTSFYFSSNNEISSRGYESLKEFYNYSIEMKAAFLKYVLDKEYFSLYSTVESFIKNDNNVYKAKPALPDYFLLGTLCNLLWIVGFAVPAYFRFKKNLFEMPVKEKKITEPQDVHLQSKSFKSWNIFEPFLYNHLYNLLSGHTAESQKKGNDLQVFFNGRELNTSKKKQNFFAPCNPAEFPGHLNVNDHIGLMMDLLEVDKIKRKEIETRYSLTSFRGKCFSQLDKEEQGRVFLATLHMKPFDIYLLNDVANDMPPEFCIALKDRMDALCDAGALVIFLYSDTNYLTSKKYKINRSFVEANHWNIIVKSLKDKYENESPNETEE